MVLGPKIDGMILVVWGGKTARDALKRAKEKLDMLKIKCLGVVINNINIQERTLPSDEDVGDLLLYRRVISQVPFWVNFSFFSFTSRRPAPFRYRTARWIGEKLPV